MTKKVDVREVIGKNLDEMLSVVQQMARTNVVSYPLKPHVLRQWCDELFRAHDEMRKLIQRSYERKS